MRPGEAAETCVRLRTAVLVVLTLICVAFLAPAESAAQSDGEGLHARLLPFKVPVLKRGRDIGTGNVTMIIRLADSDELEEVCSRLPLIRDTVIEYFFDNPVVLEPDKSFRLEPSIEPVARMVRRISGSRRVETVLLFKGDVESPGGACRRIGENEEIRSRGAKFFK